MLSKSEAHLPISIVFYKSWQHQCFIHVELIAAGLVPLAHGCSSSITSFSVSKWSLCSMGLGNFSNIVNHSGFTSKGRICYRFIWWGVKHWSQVLSFQLSFCLAYTHIYIHVSSHCISQALIKQNVVQLPPSLGASTLLHTPVVAEEPAKAKRPRYPKPDIDQLLPFKPRAIVRKLRALWMSA